MPIVKGFRRFRSNIVSFRQVVSETSNLVPGSNVRQSKWSSAAPSTPKKKRITISDRRALLESFVNKYRAVNAGKFPTPTSAVKEVGGGYYFIKKMLQEMEYNFKLSSMEKEKVPVKETKEQNKGEDTVNRKIVIKSVQSQRVSKSNSQITMDPNLYENAWIESVGKEGIQQSRNNEDIVNNIITRDDTLNIATNTHDRRAQSDKKLEKHLKDESPIKEDKLGFEGTNSKVEKQDGGTRNIIRDMHESQKDLELIEKASSSSSSSSSSIWGNLKSLASGFINIWKKQ
ncbi:hypothetical protein LXL04_021488 [Taraxacum kok-saghyz]